MTKLQPAGYFKSGWALLMEGWELTHPTCLFLSSGVLTWATGAQRKGYLFLTRQPRGVIFSQFAQKHRKYYSNGHIYR